MFILETHEGTAYERGLDHGLKFRHCIQANVHQYSYRQTFEASDEEMEAICAPLRKVLQERWPETFEELRGIAAGSQTEYVWLERMQMRIWNRVTNKPAQACTGVGVMQADGHVVLGGTLDDPRQCYVLVRDKPRDGYASVQLRWAGATWGQNGVNEAGFAVAQQSIGGFDKDVPIEPEANALMSITSRVLLQKCATVKEALAFFEGWPDKESIILADKTGDVAAVCVWGSKVFVQRPQRGGMVWNSNQMHMTEALELGARHGAKPVTQPYTQTRHDYLAEYAGKNAGVLGETDVRTILTSHSGDPHGVCNELTLCATLAPVTREPGVIYIADRPPSRNAFVRYEV
jgi:hypothetical protein